MKSSAVNSNTTTTRPKKQQNHANIPCPIENCARFTYGKLPDHLTKRHGLVGAERDEVNERQRKRFFNGELCQVKYLRESAIAQIWGDKYLDPAIRQKVLACFALVKVRIIPKAACAKDRPLTAQDANVLTDYNARLEQKTPRAPRRRREASIGDAEKRRKSCESSEGEENVRASCSSPEVEENTSARLPVPVTDPIELSKLHQNYKHVIDSLKQTHAETESTKRTRSYRKYAKRLLAYLAEHSSSNDADELLGDQKLMCDFIEQARRECKPRTTRNYVTAAIKMLESRLNNRSSSNEKVTSLTKVYHLMRQYYFSDHTFEWNAQNETYYTVTSSSVTSESC